MAIGYAIQNGTFIYIHDEKGIRLRSIQTGNGPNDGLKGYTSTTVNIQNGVYIYTYDEKGSRIKSTYIGNQPDRVKDEIQKQIKINNEKQNKTLKESNNYTNNNEVPTVHSSEPSTSDLILEKVDDFNKTILERNKNYPNKKIVAFTYNFNQKKQLPALDSFLEKVKKNNFYFNMRPIIKEIIAEINPNHSNPDQLITELEYDKVPLDDKAMLMPQWESTKFKNIIKFQKADSCYYLPTKREKTTFKANTFLLLDPDEVQEFEKIITGHSINTSKKIERNSEKSVAVAYLLWGFSIFGLLGFQRFYLEKHITGFIWLISGGAFGFGALYDLFTLYRQVDQYNE